MNRLVYNYKAKVLGVTSPDTMDLLITLGLRISVERRCYLQGCRYLELSGKGHRFTAEQKKEFADNARLFLSTVIHERRGIVAPLRPNRFGRLRVRFYLPCEREHPDYPQLTHTVAGTRFLSISNLATLAPTMKFDLDWAKSLLVDLEVSDTN